jgi:hypothetical protein
MGKNFPISIGIDLTSVRTYDAGDNAPLSAHVRGRRDKNVKNNCTARHL